MNMVFPKNKDTYNFDVEIPKSVQNNLTFLNFYKDNITTLTKLISFYRWYPDLYVDSFSDIQPEGTPRLILRPYQRIMLRSLFRFDENYICMARSSAKSFIHILAKYIKAMLYPNLSLSITSSTIDQAVKIWKEKHTEIIRFFPLFLKMFKNEKDISFCKTGTRADFVNGSEIKVLAIADTTKGSRTNEIGNEESHLINNEIFEDAVRPTTIHHRLLFRGGIDPMEESQINRFTTSGLAGSDEFGYIKEISKRMLDLDGTFVLGADWRVVYKCNQVSKKVINAARKQDEAKFRQNFLCQWIGVTEGALIDINKVINARKLYYDDCFEQKVSQKQYVISADIAASGKAGTLVVVGEIKNLPSGEIEVVKIVEIITISNNTSPSDKAIILKRIWKKYGGNFDQNLSSVKALIVDAQNSGTHIVQELMRTHVISGEVLYSLGFSTDKPTNITTEPQEKNSPKVLYAINATKHNATEMHSNFINMFTAGKVALINGIEKIKEELIRKHLSVKDTDSIDTMDISKIKLGISLNDIELQCTQAETFINETANLKIKINETDPGKYTLVRQISSIQKDRFSAIEYLLYYVNKHMSFKIEEKKTNYNDYIIGAKTLNSTSNIWKYKRG